MAGPKFHETDDSSSTSNLPVSLDTSEDYEPSSALRFVNSQLIAHGFARAPGLSIDGISNEDGQKLVKCIMAMLSQRIEDVDRTEQLKSKLRMTSYEHERLQSLNNSQQEKVENAEREMTFYKNKLTICQRSQTAEVLAHKQTTAELQRVRMSLQYLRTTTQNELKRKEKELERTLERWSKISDSHTKLSATSAGLQCANLAATCEQLLGKGIMEEALEQAEKARVDLVNENEGFRSVLLGTAHALQTIAHSVNKQDQDANTPQFSLLTPAAVFAPPMSCLTHPENAHRKIKELITDLKNACADVQLRDTPMIEAGISEEEIKKMQQTICSLRSELDTIRSSRTKTQIDFERYNRYISAQRHEHALKETVDTGTDTEQDSLRNELDKRSNELEAERKKFTAGIIKLGQERSELETERGRFLEEKRRWETDHMLVELPLTAFVDDPDLIPSPKRNLKTKATRHATMEHIVKSPKRGGFKSPTKKKVKVAFKEDKIGDSRRLKMKGKDSSEKAENLYDGTINTQLLGEPTDPLEMRNLPPKACPIEPQKWRHSIKDCKPSMPLVLPTSFTLPPPSPGSSLSLQPLVLPSSSSLTGFPFHDAPTSSTSPTASTSAASSASFNFDKIPLIPSPPAIPSIPSRPIRSLPSPRTPHVLTNIGPNGTKKHDYSPAKPSPLSRILMIADSPLSGDGGMETIKEEEEEDMKTKTSQPGVHGKSKTIRLGLNADAERVEVKNDISAHVNKTAAKEKRARAKDKATIVEKENIGIISHETKSTTETTMKGKAKETFTGPAPLKTKIMTSTTAARAEVSLGQGIKPGGARRVPLNTVGTGKVNGRLL